MMKKKYLVIISGMFLTLLSIVIFYIIISNFNSKQREEKEVKEAIGMYYLDMNKSIIYPYNKDSSNIKELRLYINSDMTFKFSNNYPFIYDSLGHWHIIEDPIYGYIQLMFNNMIKNKMTFPNNGEVQILPTPKKDMKKIELLVFKKK